MASRSPFVALVVGALVGGCTEAGRSLVIVDVAAARPAPPIETVRVAISATATGQHWHVDHDWSGDGLKLGIYLPANFRGAVTTAACGFDGAGRLIASGIGDPNTVIVKPGAVTAGVSVILAAGAGASAEGCALADAGSDPSDAAGDHSAEAGGGADSAADHPDAMPDTASDGGDANGDGRDAGQPDSDGRDAAPDAPAPGRIGHSFVSRASGVGIDLTAIGRIDWAYWGLGTPGSFNHKASGGGKIGDLVPTPTQTFSNTIGWFDWTDGTPTTSASSVVQGVLAADPGPLFCNVEASTTLRTLRIYQVVNSAVMMTVRLSDGSAPQLTVIANFATGWFEVTFRAATEGATLSVRWDIISTPDAGGGGMALFGAALF